MPTVCLTFDFDAISLWVSTFKQTTATPISRGEYGARVGLGRVLRLLKDRGLSATFFVPAHTAGAFPAETRSILEAGHEIGLHGYCHESPVGLEPAVEAQLLDRAAAKLKGVLGAAYAPIGYRSPAWDLSSASVGLLVERGFLYDSSMMADDFQPYRARRDDRVDEHGFSPGPSTHLIEMPVSWELDDFPYFFFANRPLFGNLRTADSVFEAWAGEFDYCNAKHPNGVFTLTMHPEIIGRGPRIAMLEKLIGHMQATPGTTFRSLAEEARRQDVLLPPGATAA